MGDKIISKTKKIKTAAQKKESALTLRAFEYYYGLGDSRTLSKVAKKFNRTLGSVEGWSSKLKWRDRVRQRELDVAANIAKEGFEQATEVNKRILSIIKASVDVKVVKGEDGEEEIVPLPIKNFSDAQKAHELQDRILHPERYNRAGDDDEGGNKVAVVVNITKS